MGNEDPAPPLAARARTIPNVTVSDEFSDGKGGRAGECHARSSAVNLTGERERGREAEEQSETFALSLSLLNPKQTLKMQNGRRE